MEGRCADGERARTNESRGEADAGGLTHLSELRLWSGWERSRRARGLRRRKIDFTEPESRDGREVVLDVSEPAKGRRGEGFRARWSRCRRCRRTRGTRRGGRRSRCGHGRRAFAGCAPRRGRQTCVRGKRGEIEAVERARERGEPLRSSGITGACGFQRGELVEVGRRRDVGRRDRRAARGLLGCVRILNHERVPALRASHFHPALGDAPLVDLVGRLAGFALDFQHGSSGRPALQTRGWVMEEYHSAHAHPEFAAVTRIAASATLRSLLPVDSTCHHEEN